MFQLIVVPLILAVWGVLIRYWPALQKVPNNLIPWINTVLAILIKMATPENAHAGTWDFLHPVADKLGWLLPVIQAAIAKGLWETYGRPTLDLSGATPTPSATDPQRARKR